MVRVYPSFRKRSKQVSLLGRVERSETQLPLQAGKARAGQGPEGLAAFELSAEYGKWSCRVELGRMASNNI